MDEELNPIENNRVYFFLAGNWYRPETGQHTVPGLSRNGPQVHGLFCQLENFLLIGNL